MSFVDVELKTKNKPAWFSGTEASRWAQRKLKGFREFVVHVDVHAEVFWWSWHQWLIWPHKAKVRRSECEHMVIYRTG